MANAIAQHKPRPVISRVFAFEELRLALDYMASGKHFRKIHIKH
jgi:hypothetical protein